ncbi:MAG: hypothetical protein ACRC62_00675 [Microcoleus sp.]
MPTVYRVKASELDLSFVEQIKAKFAGKEIEIVVSEIDETTYLLQDNSNKNHLLNAIDNINSRQKLVEVNLQELQQSE